MSVEQMSAPAAAGAGPTLDVLALLQPYRNAGVLHAADVHTAAVLARLVPVRDPDAVLAAALAVRAPRLSHVCVDLRTVAWSIVPDLGAPRGNSTDDAAVDAVDQVAALRWPEPEQWIRTVTASGLVDVADAPLVLRGSNLYLERYDAYEQFVVADLRRRAALPVTPIAPASSVLDLLLTGEGSDEQRAAVSTALGTALTVLVGGPGTGKTTTVAALLASLVAAGGSDLRVALAAPTGKAAARLGEAFREAATRLEPELARRLVASEASTLHRLLGTQRRSASRFMHDRHRPLPHDVVIVDETSMVSLPMIAKLLDAIRPDARVVLVGDPGQLASIEAGSVLADVAGPHADDDGTGGTSGADADASGSPSGRGAPSTAPLAAAVSVLHRSRRFPPGSPIDQLARAVRRGDADLAIEVLRRASADAETEADREADTAIDTHTGVGAPTGKAAPTRTTLSWIDRLPDSAGAVARIRAVVEPVAAVAVDAALAGDVLAALAAQERMRILCAHRRGPSGVQRWNQRLEGWLAAQARPVAGWYPGRPLLVTANDYRLGLFNGDLGVVVATPRGPMVAFPVIGGEPRLVSPARLADVETVHAMTIHKSQGSEFDDVVVVVPPAGSRLATRELLYTAVTRARRRVTLVGDEAAIRDAVTARIERATGLRDALWGA